MTEPRLTSFAPQFLVADLRRSTAFYHQLGFRFGEPWGGLYAIGLRDGLELHLKAAPKNPTEWGTKDFYVEDPDGYIIAFGGIP